jgi:hypothetical protein
VITVFFGKPHHRILHDIKRGFLIAYGELSLLESPTLNAGKESR